ncbi:Linear gramicidin dehydrogenase LgrE [Streptomyces sp. YIM 130001]|uniref:thioesterase II family protein n=1 Tax=Streptomyces sp. YIM 130001 TaxID=2259644 RepID=UPI000E651D48|nr:alpha/beta fold hydrolase [Streptomyces sp. YIM 130001]RII13402.1 Linear gramicidin dehydrogenase LgrE [Streptomyces sp. YIM 130001]
MTTATLTERGLWVRQFRPARPRAPRLLCVPHAGGSAGFYLPFSDALSPELNVLAVQYPGRQDRRREPAARSIAPLADALFGLLDPEDTTPLALFGHSMGAVVAFELARRLEADGRPVSLLVASARRGPFLPPGPSFHHLGDAAILAEVERLNGADGLPPEHPGLLKLALPALRADFQAVETYRAAPAPLLTCPVIAMTGVDDPRVPPADARAWSAVTTAPVTLSVHPGGHFYLLARVPEIATELGHALTGQGREVHGAGGVRRLSQRFDLHANMTSEIF